MVADDEALDVLFFWWQAGPARWFAKDDDFDADIKARFADLHRRASAGTCDAWAETREGMLALILVLDQFSRNLGRGTPAAFANDPKALELARIAVGRGDDRAFPVEARAFFYLPFMHAESLADQERCVDFCRVGCTRDTYTFALEHMDIVRRFGRFPHRNAVLGRRSTPAELAYIESGGFSG
ncbi:DUF924 family protein [Methylobrevis pamukkalensis]|uniref:DUF924 domain-containing protein n=1 Tax=Methylobrevis pamukkalensis TaxID=1439726 RepID=A0A1E3H6W3_9HYPH|nr:DUF924 family protein [Methylobrevis pamukkalensis]ODN72060.1 hypothetical protein A6302_00575 [Methylobrevis pamukkalensis]